jgi:hypothetical protein
MRRLARFLVFGACLLTMWLVAGPARADGPACDDRGATVVAPSPALVDVFPTVEACEVYGLAGWSSGAPAILPQAPGAPTVPSSSPATLIPAMRPPLAPPEGVRLGLDVARTRAPSGVTERVERPPRA